MSLKPASTLGYLGKFINERTRQYGSFALCCSTPIAFFAMYDSVIKAF